MMRLDDDTFLAGFRNQTLCPEQFGHRAHLRMAWLYLKRYPLADACAYMCTDTRAFAESLGVPGKYHHTVTEALMRVVDLRTRGAGGPKHAAIFNRMDSFDDFLAANPDLQADARAVLARHYSDDCLNSDTARLRWVEPDLAPIERAD